MFKTTKSCPSVFCNIKLENSLLRNKLYSCIFHSKVMHSWKDRNKIFGSKLVS